MDAVILRKASGWTWPGFTFTYHVCKVATHTWPEKEAVDQRRAQPNHSQSAAIYFKALFYDCNLAFGALRESLCPAHCLVLSKAEVNVVPSV